MSSFSIIRGGDMSIVFNHDNNMFNIQELRKFSKINRRSLHDSKRGISPNTEKKGWLD